MTAASSTEKQGWLNRSLNTIERVGNKLPDPALLFAMFMVAVWIISWALSGVTFDEIDPRSGKPIQVINLLDGSSFTAFMAKLVNTFVSFPPLGVVLVAMLGLGVAEYTGFNQCRPAFDFGGNTKNAINASAGGGWHSKPCRG